MAASLITVLFLFFCQLQSASADPQRQPIKEITAQPGDDVTLPCQAPNNVNISAVQWIRSDLERLVYLKEDGHLMKTDQDPSYVNRVQLEDNEMKNGDLSLILKNVNNNDEGTYVCRYKEKTGGRRKRNLDFNFNPSVIFHLNIDGSKKHSLQQITAHPGSDVILPCQAPNITIIETVEWIRSGLNGTVFQSMTKTKHEYPSHENRVQLKDNEMKNGELSLILKNVNIDDEGAYACLSEGMKGTDPIKFMSIVHLNVEDGDAEDGYYKYGLLASVILNVVVIGGFVIYKKCKGRSDDY